MYRNSVKSAVASRWINENGVLPAGGGIEHLACFDFCWFIQHGVTVRCKIVLLYHYSFWDEIACQKKKKTCTASFLTKRGWCEKKSQPKYCFDF